MENWKTITALLCIYGFFYELRPSEPFVTEFLSSHQWRNLTTEQILQDVYPWATYAYLVQLVIVFLITDMLRCYKQREFIDSVLDNKLTFIKFIGTSL